MKKILFASQKLHVPLGEGGGETIAFDLLGWLGNEGGAQVKALGAFQYVKLEALHAAMMETGVDMRLNQQMKELECGGGKFYYPHFAHIVYQMPGSYPTTLAREDHYGISLSEFLKQFAPDTLFLQAEGSFEVWNAVKREKLFQTFFYVQNGYEMGRFQASRLDPPRLLVNSAFVQQKIKSLYGFGSDLLYPAIELSRYRPVGPREKNEQFTVLFINPVAVKGLAVFLGLAEALPELRFLALEGWTPIEGAILEMLSSKPNITCLRRTWRMADIYRRADLLIAPSQWEEAFGRVIVEAHAAGVPTLASRVGGLPESSGEAGFLVDDYKNPQAWVDELRRLAGNPALLEEKRPLMEANASRFTPENAGKRFLEIAGAV